MIKMILVSACLAGLNCKYNGGNNYNEEIFNLVKEGKAYYGRNLSLSKINT